MKLVEGIRSILRMDLATLQRYVFISRASKSNDVRRSLLFFMPCEELDGGSIFSYSAKNFNLIQPFLDQINGSFIMMLNNHSKSISKLTCPPELQDCNSKEETFMTSSKTLMSKQQRTMMEKRQRVQGYVHMYQMDIDGNTAIDKAFRHNAIFCVKALGETILTLPDDDQFRSCFDKALVMMIQKGVDVKELVKSPLFFGSLWETKVIFSNDRTTRVAPYNGDADDLEFEDPEVLFMNTESISNQSRLRRRSSDNTFSIVQKIWRKIREMVERVSEYLEEEDGERGEQNEMEFNYINMEELQGDNKLEVIRTLSDCDDIYLFDQEPIQHIIDYKWDTYARQFF
jgi:hypothetical protein